MNRRSWLDHKDPASRSEGLILLSRLKIARLGRSMLRVKLRVLLNCVMVPKGAEAKLSSNREI